MDAIERYFDTKIKAVDIIEPRFKESGENAFEVQFTVEDEEGKEIELFLEVSDRAGMGTLAGKSQMQITKETLGHLGYKFGDDYSQVETLIGSPCRVRAKLNAKGNLNYYFATGRVVIKDKKVIAGKVAAIMKQLQACKPEAQPAEAEAEDEVNPFGPKK